MKYPTSLTINEWNLLMKWSRYSKLDTWFELRSQDSIDYVYDLEEDENMTLHDGIQLLCEGIYIDKKDWNVTNKEIKIWNRLMDKFTLQIYKI